MLLQHSISVPTWLQNLQSRKCSKLSLSNRFFSHSTSSPLAGPLMVSCLLPWGCDRWRAVSKLHNQIAGWDTEFVTGTKTTLLQPFSPVVITSDENEKISWNYDEDTLLNSFDNHDYPDTCVSKICLVNELDESLAKFKKEELKGKEVAVKIIPTTKDNFFLIAYSKGKLSMAPTSKADKKATLDTAAWMFNVVTSVGIIIINKALMATYSFSFDCKTEYDPGFMLTGSCICQYMIFKRHLASWLFFLVLLSAQLRM